MITARVIPCLDVDRGRVVKGVNFVDLRDAGDPVELAARYDAEGADELVFLDITASSDDRETTIDMVSRTAEKVFIPFTVGGGVRSVEDARRLLRAGADKVGVNTAALERPELLSEIADEFGAQCVVIAIDARRVDDGPGDTNGDDGAGDETAGGHPANTGQRWQVFTRGGRVNTGVDAIEWAIRAQDLGAGEVLLTSMDRDGTKDGFDLELTSAVSSAVTIPVIASGGVGTPQHLVEGVTIGGATGVLAASVFHFGEFSVAEAKSALSEAGVAVRPNE